MAQTNPPAASTPTMSTAWNRAPYQAPSTWERGEPCTCGDCPDCDNPTTLREPTRVDFTDNGKCYQGNVPVLLPAVETITGDWCVSFKSADGPGLTVTPSDFGVVVVVDGADYGSARVLNGEGCICFDGKDFIATGDFIGGQPN